MEKSSNEHQENETGEEICFFESNRTRIQTRKGSPSSDLEVKLYDLEKVVGSKSNANISDVESAIKNRKQTTNLESKVLTEIDGRLYEDIIKNEAEEKFDAIIDHENLNANQIMNLGCGNISEEDPAFSAIVPFTNEDSLAVAVAVSPEKDLNLIPAAIEYDVDSKPPMYKNRRFRLYMLAAIILLFSLGIGTAICTILLKRSSFNRTKETTFSLTNTLDPRKQGIANRLKQVVGKARFAIEGSPHARAAEWIFNEDPMQLSKSSENLIQRYLLALFYFSTTGVKPWKSCNRPLNTEIAECQFSKLVQTFPQKYEYIPWFRWLSKRHECDWAGIICDEFNQTRAIELSGQQIFGTFPTEISRMPYLQSLTLNSNEFYGPLPSELSKMKHLLNIELHYNLFTGQVPAEWYKAQALQRINFAGNLLTGTIPSEIGLLSATKGYFMQENSLSGTFPTEIGNMKFLTFSRWSRNFLTGTLPTEIGKLDQVQEVWTQRNQFVGTLPHEMVNMKELGDLRLHFNNLSGEIPEEHYNMSQLRRWDLYHCKFEGTMSTNIKNLVNLQTYRIKGNSFHGSIPKEMGDLSNLAIAWLQENDFTGAVPIEVCSNRGPIGINILEVDCAPIYGIADPPVECLPSCCTSCCDSLTGYCVRG